MKWAILLHLYQPPYQKKEILKKVTQESYLPLIRILEETKAKITLNLCGSLTEQLAKNNYSLVLKRIKRLAGREKIEFTGSACYHPILPLLSKKEVERQIELNEKINKKYFGSTWPPKPKGFFLPELAYDKKTACLIEANGYQWIILDELAYQGKVGRVSFEKNYQIKDLKLKVFFRNRGLSDIFFTGWLDSEEKFWQAVKNDGRSRKFLLTAFDGENLGHHKPGIEKIFEQLVKKITTLTYSELLKELKNQKEIVEPLPSNWSSREQELKEKIFYSLWFHPKNEIHQLQWTLTKFIIKIVEKNKKNANYKKARTLLDQTLNSCQYWWASATPWWSVEIINRGAEKLVEVLKMLKNLDKEIVNQGKKIKEKIISTTQNWQSSGKVKKIKEDYLKGKPIRYFGGKILK